MDISLEDGFKTTALEIFKMIRSGPDLKGFKMAVYKLESHAPEIHPSAYVAPTATLIGNVSIKKDASIWFNCVLRGDENHISVGEGTNIQDFTMIHVDPEYDVIIGNNVTVGHGAIIHGCRIEDGCLIGIGAKVLNGAVVGRGSTIAAGSVVLENTQIPPNSMVTGMPGKVKKKNSDEMQKVMLMMAEVYREESKKYKDKQKFSLVEQSQGGL